MNNWIEDKYNEISDSQICKLDLFILFHYIIIINIEKLIFNFILK